ncbi:MAG: endonuclease III domain-containing protein, partial [bacterium]
MRRPPAKTSKGKAKPKSARPFKESAKDKQARARQIVARLKAKWPDATCTLTYSNPLELLVATILSAQCTDVRVNQETPAIFKKYRTAKHYADAPIEELEKAIQRTGFYRNKAKAIKGATQTLVERHNAEVPARMEDLVALSGV